VVDHDGDADPPRASVLVVSIAPAIDRYHWLDELVVGAVNRPSRVVAQPGGKALNAARVLRHLGVAVTVVVPAPGDAGVRLRGALARRGIDVRLVDVAAELRQTMTMIDERRVAATEVYEPAADLADTEWAAVATETVVAIASGMFAAVVISGARSGGGAHDAAMVEIVAAAGQRGLRLFVDSRAATVAALLSTARSVGVGVVVKVNADEAVEVVGRAGDIDGDVDNDGADLRSLANALVSCGATAAAVTGGTRGAVYAGADGEAAVGPPTVPGPYPGGSGDAFLAGLVAGELSGGSVDSSLALAKSCAEANARQPIAGSWPGFSIDG